MGCGFTVLSEKASTDTECGLICVVTLVCINAYLSMYVCFSCLDPHVFCSWVAYALFIEPEKQQGSISAEHVDFFVSLFSFLFFCPFFSGQLVKNKPLDLLQQAKM